MGFFMLESNLARKIHDMIWMVWACIILCFFSWNFLYICKMVTGQGLLWVYLFLYILACALLAKLYLFLHKRVERKKFAFVIFTGAFLIRLIALGFNAYVPDNDFLEYYRLGIDFYEGNHALIGAATIGSHDSKLAGIAVFYGTLAHIFSPSVLGFQLANCVITALICLMIYVLASFASEKAALAAAFLYTVYPASILSTQMTANHHGATLFLLIAFYAFYRSLRCDVCEKGGKGRAGFFAWAAMAGCALTCSDLIHPSALLGLCALAAFSMVQTAGGVFSRGSRPKTAHLLSPLLALLVVALLYSGTLDAGLEIMQSKGMADRDQDITLLFKIRLGMDIEHGGMWWAEGNSSIMEIEDRAEQRAFCIQEIKRNLSDRKGTLRLIRNKTRSAWFDTDGYFYFYPLGRDTQLDASIKAAQDPAQAALLEQERTKLNETVALLGRIDTIFVYLIWALSLIGLFCLKRTDHVEIYHLMLWLPAGWMAFICISELQSRYRYPAMPSLMMLAGLGAAAMWDRIHSKDIEKRSL